jgi:hypothetical protein
MRYCLDGFLPAKTPPFSGLSSRRVVEDVVFGHSIIESSVVFCLRTGQHYDPIRASGTVDGCRCHIAQERHLLNVLALQGALQLADSGRIVAVERLPIHYIHQQKTAGLR